MTAKSAKHLNPSLVLLFVALCLLSVMAILKTIFVSFDIDEGYTLAMAYRLARGDRLFVEMWESHQMSAVFLMPFVWLYLFINGSATGIVIFTRVLGTILHLMLGGWVAVTVRKQLPSWGTFLVFLLHVNFLPKWIQTPEFELLQYWFAIGMILLIYRYYVRGKGLYRVFLAGMLVTAQMMLYPTQALLYPAGMLAIYWLGRKLGRSARREMVAYTCGAFVPGFVFLGALTTYISPQNLIRNLSEIMLDESHTLVPMAVKWKIYFADLTIPLMTSLVCGILMYVIYRIHRNAARFVIPILTIFVSFIHLFSCLFGEENQFYFLWRYLLLTILGLEYVFLFRVRKDAVRGPVPVKRPEDQKVSLSDTSLAGLVLLLFGMLFSIVSFLSVLLITNMDVNTTCSRLFPALLAIFMILMMNTVEIRYLHLMIGIGLISLMGSLFMGKLIQMRVTGCIQITVLAPMTQMADGPLKGIYVTEDLASVYEDDAAILGQYLGDGVKLLYMGGESILYLWSGAEVASPSTQGTSAYNQMFTDYYELYPEQIPDVIVVDKEMGDNPVYYVSPSNQIMLDWISEVYCPSQVIESNYLKIYLK